jgi:hypothetical protein
VFVVVALSAVPIGVVRLRFDSDRNAIYEASFDARTKLRGSFSKRGIPIEKAPVRP